MPRVTQTAEIEALAIFGAAYGISNAYSQSASKTASAVTSTSITTSGLTAHDSQGCMIIGNTVADWSGTTLYGNAQDNTTTVITVDGWYTMAGVVSGSTPSSTGPFVIVPAPAPFWFAALSDSVSAVSAGDKGSAMGGTELTSNGLARQKITTVTRTAGTSGTMSLSTVFTYTGSVSQNIGRGMITNSKVASKDFGYFLDQINSGTPAVVSTNGDTFTPTWTVTIA